MEEKQSQNKFLKGLKWFFFSFIWLAVLLFVADLVSKLCIVNYFKTHDEPIVIIKGFLELTYITNSKSAFGLGLHQPMAHRIIFIVIALAGLALAIFFYVKKFKDTKAIVKACLMLIAVGALGNLIDRVFYSASFLTNDFLIAQFGGDVNEINDGAVVDWIDFCFNRKLWNYPFNIADSCVVVGTIMLIVYLIVEEIVLAVKKRNQEVKEGGDKILSVEEQKRLEEEQKEDFPEQEKEAKPQPEKEEKKEE